VLTIGEVARLSGLTVRAVRHYHQRGLLPEPGRDHSGYRRYVADDVVALIRIKTLAEAGVPLSRVGELLEADEEEFAEAIAEIDVRLHEEEWTLQLRRKRVAALVAGEGLALPEEVVAYLTELREHGFSERMIEIERDGWILISAHAPEHVPRWIGAKREALTYPGYVDYTRRFDEAFAWAPDDPRLVELADDMAEGLASLPEEDRERLIQDDADVLDQQLAAVLDAQSIASSPAWARLAELLEERGMDWVRMDKDRR
jgi:DNA-binding transcriptional MerR regulator